MSLLSWTDSHSKYCGITGCNVYVYDGDSSGRNAILCELPDLARGVSRGWSGEKLFVFSPSFGLTAYDYPTGKIIWNRNDSEDIRHVIYNPKLGHCYLLVDFLFDVIVMDSTSGKLLDIVENIVLVDCLGEEGFLLERNRDNDWAIVLEPGGIPIVEGRERLLGSVEIVVCGGDYVAIAYMNGPLDFVSKSTGELVYRLESTEWETVVSVSRCADPQTFRALATRIEHDRMGWVIEVDLKKRSHVVIASRPEWGWDSFIVSWGKRVMRYNQELTSVVDLDSKVNTAQSG